MMRPTEGGPPQLNGDPDDPPPRNRPVSRIEPELRNGDPDDPPPGSRPVSSLIVAKEALVARTKPARRDRPATKASKRRAGSRRR